MNSTVTVHGEATRRGLRNLAAGIVQAAELTLRAAEDAAVASAKATTRFKDQTGGTRASIRRVRTGLTGFVEARGAARFLEGGTRPHVIHGNPVLRFTVNGQVLYRRWVRHPGTAPRPFMEEAARVAFQTAEFAGEYYVNYAIQRAR